VLTGAELERVLRPLDHAFASGKPCRVTDHPVDLDGRDESVFGRRHVDLTAWPLRDDAGVITRVAVMAIDVSDQVADRRASQGAADTQRALRAEAEAASTAKDRFLASLGHELRDPLAAMLATLEVIRVQGAHPHELDVLERQLGHLTRLVGDVLDVSRIAHGHVELRRRNVELAAVVADAVEIAGPLIEQRGHRLRVQVPHPGLIVHVDPSRMAQVVENLLTNAAKYSEPGGEISVQAGRVGTGVRLSVKDRGVGIAPQMLERIFDPFEQQDPADRARGGLGLGLAIVRNIVELHGGRVHAHSAGLGRGSEFVVELPALAGPVRSSPADDESSG
jgi:signal transduction histidine kinase